MLVVRVSSLTGNEVGHLDKVPGELVKMANDQCDVPPLYAIRFHFSVHRVAGVPSVQVLGVLNKVQLDFCLPVFQPTCFVAIVSSVRRDADSRQES